MAPLAELLLVPLLSLVDNGWTHSKEKKPVQDRFPICDEFPVLMGQVGFWPETRPNLPAYFSVWDDEFGSY